MIFLNRFSVSCRFQRVRDLIKLAVICSTSIGLKLSQTNYRKLLYKSSALVPLVLSLSLHARNDTNTMCSRAGAFKLGANGIGWGNKAFVGGAKTASGDTSAVPRPVMHFSCSLGSLKPTNPQVIYGMLR